MGGVEEEGAIVGKIAVAQLHIAKRESEMGISLGKEQLKFRGDFRTRAGDGLMIGEIAAHDNPAIVIKQIDQFRQSAHAVALNLAPGNPTLLGHRLALARRPCKHRDHC